jgi:hypothetical protein
LTQTPINPSNNPTATNATLVLSNVQSGGFVYVVVSNSLSFVSSTNAFLQVTNDVIFPPGFTAKSYVDPTQGIRIVPLAISPSGVTVEVSPVSPFTAGEKLILEFKDDLRDPQWRPLSTNDSSNLKLTDPAPPLNRARYYRVRVE